MLEWEWVGMGMGMIRGEWEGNGTRKSFPHTSTTNELWNIVQADLKLSLSTHRSDDAGALCSSERSFKETISTNRLSSV